MPSAIKAIMLLMTMSLTSHATAGAGWLGPTTGGSKASTGKTSATQNTKTGTASTTPISQSWSYPTPSQIYLHRFLDPSSNDPWSTQIKLGQQPIPAFDPESPNLYISAVERSRIRAVIDSHLRAEASGRSGIGEQISGTEWAPDRPLAARTSGQVAWTYGCQPLGNERPGQGQLIDASSYQLQSNLSTAQMNADTLGYAAGLMSEPLGEWKAWNGRYVRQFRVPNERVTHNFELLPLNPSATLLCLSTRRG